MYLGMHIYREREVLPSGDLSLFTSQPKGGWRGIPPKVLEKSKFQLKEIILVVVSNIFNDHPKPWGNDPI